MILLTIQQILEEKIQKIREFLQINLLWKKEMQLFQRKVKEETLRSQKNK